MGAEYRKSRRNAPRGFFECEGKGLEWLGEAQAQGGPRVVKVYGWGDDYLDIGAGDPRDADWESSLRIRCRTCAYA